MTDVNSLKSVLKFLHTPAKSYDDVEYEPTFKASSMFPILCGNGMSATISFMNYWKFKNEIESISCVATIRSAEGETLKRVYFPVDQPVHSLRFPELVGDFLIADGSFLGSCEVEFFAVEDLKFPYPAVSIFYETAKGVSAVHTASRVFHSIGDMDKRLMTDIQESGFDIHSDDDRTPFICFTNGPRPVAESKMVFTAFNAQGKEMVIELPTEALRPYQTLFVFPEEHQEMREFLHGNVGFCKVLYEPFGIFPRLMCGNMAPDRSQVTLTHSYYDISVREEYFDSDLSGEIRNAFLAIPLTMVEETEIDVSFYPIFSPGEVKIRASIFDGQGELLGEEEEFGTVVSPGTQMISLKIRDLMQRLEIPLESSSLLSIEGYSPDNKLPTRINFGVNHHRPSKAGTNINTSMYHGAQFDAPRRSYLWQPVFIREDLQNFALITALSSRIDDKFTAQAHLDLFSESRKIWSEELEIQNQTSIRIKLEDLIYKAGYTPREGEILWCTIESDCPYLGSTYLMTSDQGFIGGDHSY
jgi:hypothetical protein